MPKPKPLCKVCQKPYDKVKFGQVVCSPYPCGVEWGKRQKQKAAEKALKKDTRERKQKLKTRSDWLKEAQEACNAYIRERDKHLPCVSCGRYHEGQYHAGHYRSVGAAPELRYHAAFNIWKQCAPCNNHKSGNPIDYRIELEKRIGRRNLEWLEGPHQAQHYTIEDAKEIKAYFKAQLKLLKESE